MAVKAKQELDLSAYQWNDDPLNGYIRQIKREKTSHAIFKGIGSGIFSAGAFFTIAAIAEPANEDDFFILQLQKPASFFWAWRQ